MFSGNSRKFLTAAVFILVFLNACRFWQKPGTTAPDSPSAVVENADDEIPFQIKEPENYQAEIINIVYANGEKTETKSFTAQSGIRRLDVFNADKKNETAFLETGTGETFLIYRAKKIYAENQSAGSISGNSGDDFLTTEWLNARKNAAFEKLETENNLTKYRVRLDGSENSEILIYFDENLRVPVKQEIYTINGDQKTLMFSAEITNFKAEADEKNFELPKDFRKVSTKEFEETLWREKIEKND